MFESSALFSSLQCLTKTIYTWCPAVTGRQSMALLIFEDELSIPPCRVLIRDRKCYSLPTRSQDEHPAACWPHVATMLWGTSELVRGGSGVLTTWIPRVKGKKKGQGPLVQCWEDGRMAELLERAVFPRMVIMEEQEKMGGSEPACPAGAGWEMKWGIVFLLHYSTVSTSMTPFSQCPGHWPVRLGPPFLG